MHSSSLLLYTQTKKATGYKRKMRKVNPNTSSNVASSALSWIQKGMGALAAVGGAMSATNERWEFEDANGKWSTYPADVCAALHASGRHQYTAPNNHSYRIEL